MDPEEYRKDIERKIIVLIEEKLMNGQMDAQRAKQISRLVLNTLHPPLTLDEIYRIVPTLDDHFSELASIVIPIQNEHQEKIKQIVTIQVNKLIQEHRLEEAHQLTLKAIKGEISVQ